MIRIIALTGLFRHRMEWDGSAELYDKGFAAWDVIVTTRQIEGAQIYWAKLFWNEKLVAEIPDKDPSY